MGSFKGTTWALSYRPFSVSQSAVEPQIHETLTRLTMPFNLTGHPVVTLPAGIDEHSGVPMGVQLVGRRNKERDLLATAERLESLLEPQGNRALNIS